MQEVAMSATRTMPVPATRRAASSGCPASLTDAIRRAVRHGGEPQRIAGRVAGQLRRHLPGPGILTPAQRRGDPAGYQTHLVHAEPGGSFSIAAMVWLPGQQTPVHDHVSWCVTGVLQGAEDEEIFALGADGGFLAKVTRRCNPAGTVTGFAPPGDIHRVRNAGDIVAVSMHVYGADLPVLGSSIRRVYDLPVRAPGQ
jgi:predicted metal-dependent enzyme (double-stranded beta helix superfamily)